MTLFRIWIIGCLIQFGATQILDKVVFESLKGYSKITKVFDKPELALQGIFLRESYDYIIVGASPAGCVLANRLTEDASVYVLLVEAGAAPYDFVNIPAVADYLQDTDYNWGYVSEVQNSSCLSLIDQRCALPHGKGLGGSSLINLMIYVRGNRRDFKEWRKAGNEGWGYDDVLKYFLKSEDANFPGMTEGYHSVGGPLTVEYSPFHSEVSNSYIKSANEAGYPSVDYNAHDQMGVSHIQYMLKNGQRMSANRAFLEQSRNRPNLDVITNSLATKIEIDTQTMKATGVHVMNKITLVINYIKASREVILSAGAFETPKLLMLSGIGPAAHLDDMGIPLVKNLPVGETLYDHVGTVAPIYTFPKPFSDIKNYTVFDIPGLYIDFLGGAGILTTPGIETVTFVHTNNTDNSDPGYPDIEITQEYLTIGNDPTGIFAKNRRFTPELFDSVFAPLKYLNAMHFSPLILRPKSKGYLRLASKRPTDPPLIYPNYYDNQEDVRVMIAGIRETMRIASMKSFQQLGAQVYEAVVPGCDFKFNTDEYWECYIRHITQTFYHQVSTCKMGPVRDSSSVVNERLLVHGFQNLRVVDISVIPFPPSGHTCAHAYMIGEKAADMIKEDNTLLKMALNTLSKLAQILKKIRDFPQSLN